MGGTSNGIGAGVFCGRCGSKMYLTMDGSHYRCPNCDDGTNTITWDVR